MFGQTLGPQERSRRGAAKSLNTALLKPTSALGGSKGQRATALPNVRQNFCFAKKQILGQIGRLLRLCKYKKAFSFRRLHLFDPWRGALPLYPAEGCSRPQLLAHVCRWLCGSFKLRPWVDQWQTHSITVPLMAFCCQLEHILPPPPFENSRSTLRLVISVWFDDSGVALQLGIVSAVLKVDTRGNNTSVQTRAFCAVSQ